MNTNNSTIYHKNLDYVLIFMIGLDNMLKIIKFDASKLHHLEFNWASS